MTSQIRPLQLITIRGALPWLLAWERLEDSMESFKINLSSQLVYFDDFIFQLIQQEVPYIKHI